MSRPNFQMPGSRPGFLQEDIHVELAGQNMVGPKNLRDQQAIHVQRHRFFGLIDAGVHFCERVVAIRASAAKMQLLLGDHVAHPFVADEQLGEISFGDFFHQAGRLIGMADCFRRSDA